MRTIACLALVALVGCSSLSSSEAKRFDEDLTTYVKLAPKRASMDPAELAAHDALGAGLLGISGKLSGRIK